ncbi:class I SAM-dependent methyltransferase [Halalkalibacter alkalisediminis]|uniref:Class I SAM-dependent methyltransferase n=1 Tax=Halalkalibacter alkalisediminis TaxID=935616 RepID=A0ABV6NNR4_9BACI|nr:class I SAM-dependent methyltransferase [Halalkalibacter alkalisediminis]
MVKEARKLNKNYIDTGLMDITQSDIEDMPFNDNIFDKVYTVHTIYFWNDLDKGLNETYRVLKQNGALYISIMDKSHMKKLKRTQNFNLLDRQEIVTGLENNNFREMIIHNKGAYLCIEAKK